MSKDPKPGVPVPPHRLRCRLEPTGLGVTGRKKQELTGIVRFLGQKEAENFLSDRPFGSCLLRIDNPNSDKTPYAYHNLYRCYRDNIAENVFSSD